VNTVPSGTNPVDGITKAVTSVTSFVSNVVASCHKEAALVMGFLTATGVSPSPVGTSKQLSAVLVAYAAICHIADKFGKAA
jgi:hypothetical protein